MGRSAAFSGVRPSAPRRWGKSIEGSLTRRLRPFRDALINRKYVQSGRRFLVTRHPAGLPSYYSSFLEWIACELPEVRGLFELRLLPCRVDDWSKYSLVIPWLPDTLLYRSASARDEAAILVCSADAHGVPVINRPERLVSTSKHDCAQQLAAIGIRTPHTTRIRDAAEFRRNLDGRVLPLLIREDLAHGGWSPVYLVERREDLKTVPLEQFERPIAVEFVDVRSPEDGLVRKYRYMAIGEKGVAHSLQISRRWEVRSGVRLLNRATIDEEIGYTCQADPNHERLQAACRTLGLDFVAFDYSYDRSGELVVWEINVLPGLGLPSGPKREHLIRPIERVMAATLRMYLQYAKCEVPLRLDDMLRSDADRLVAA